MIEKDSELQTRERTIKDLVNTPFKKATFAVQILSYTLIVGSPFIGGAIGGFLDLRASRIGGLILGIFITGEILFYGLKSEFSLNRQAFLTNLSVADTDGIPVEWAQVYVNGRFVGSTNKDGKIPIRWKGHQPETAVRFKGSESLGLLVPGEMKFVITTN